MGTNKRRVFPVPAVTVGALREMLAAYPDDTPFLVMEQGTNRPLAFTMGAGELANLGMWDGLVVVAVAVDLAHPVEAFDA